MLDNTPSLEKVISDALERRLTEVHTTFPARVERVDVALAQCDVKPLIKRKYPDGTLVEIPVITNVPIAVYRAGAAFVSLPVKVGDYVKVDISERSLDLWLILGGVVDPKDPRKFDLSDAIAYPGVYPFTVPPVGASADNIVIKNVLGRIDVLPNGKFLFQGALFEMMAVLSDFMDKVINAQVLDPLTGSQPLNPATITLLTAIKTQFDTLKG